MKGFFFKKKFGLGRTRPNHFGLAQCYLAQYTVQAMKSEKLTCNGSWWFLLMVVAVALQLRTGELRVASRQFFFFFSASLSYSFLFLHSLLFSDSSSVFDGVLPYYGGAAIVGGTASGDQTLVPSGGEKKGSLLLFFPSVQRHQFLLFLHDCCSAARRGKKMARG